MSAGTGPLRVGLDVTPLLGTRTGIGRYTEHLVRALAQRDDVRVRGAAFTLRGGRGLSGVLPAGVGSRTLLVPARGLRAVWSRWEHPSVRPFVGPVQVFHGTNFVLPPTGRAAGVVTVHDLAYLHQPDTVDRASRALRELVPKSLSRAAVVCTPTAAVADAVREAYGPSAPPVVVTPLGVGEEWFSASPLGEVERRARGLPEDYWLFVGTREPRKDLATLLEAHRRARAVADVPPLVLVGPTGWGPDQPPQAGVQILGYLDQGELPAVVAGARALVLPSRDEGFGLPALEALAAGTPVIVSRIPALLEVTGGHASSFPVGDADALAGLLVASAEASDPSDPSAPVAGARDVGRAYASGFRWQRCAAATVGAYRMAVEHSG